MHQMIASKKDIVQQKHTIHDYLTGTENIIQNKKINCTNETILSMTNADKCVLAHLLNIMVFA